MLVDIHRSFWGIFGGSFKLLNSGDLKISPKFLISINPQKIYKMEPKEIKPENNSAKLLMEEQAKKKAESQKKGYLMIGAVILVAIVTMFIMQGVKIHRINENVVDVQALKNKVDTMSNKIDNVVMPKLDEYNDIMAEFKQKQENFASKNEINILNQDLAIQERILRKMSKDVKKFIKDHSEVDSKGAIIPPTPSKIVELKKEFLDSVASIGPLEKLSTGGDQLKILENLVSKNPNPDVISDILVADTTIKAPPKNLKSNQTKIRFEKFFGIKK